jgi:succinate dehydrogenase/fumarate reductase flavoprotein subunit
MDELVKRIEAKRKVVQSTREAMKRAIENQNTASIQRQKNIIKKTVGEIYELKVEVQEIRIQKGDDEEEIQTWTNDMELELEAWDNELENVSI